MSGFVVALDGFHQGFSALLQVYQRGLPRGPFEAIAGGTGMGGQIDSLRGEEHIQQDMMKQYIVFIFAAVEAMCLVGSHACLALRRIHQAHVLGPTQHYSRQFGATRLQ